MAISALDITAGIAPSRTFHILEKGTDIMIINLIKILIIRFVQCAVSQTESVFALS